MLPERLDILEILIGRIRQVGQGALQRAEGRFSLGGSLYKSEPAARLSTAGDDYLRAVIQVSEYLADPGFELSYAVRGHLIPLVVVIEIDCCDYIVPPPGGRGNRGRVLTHNELLRSIWGPNKPGDLRALRTHLRRLGQKLGEDASNPTYFFAELRVGYRMAKGEGPEQVEAVAATFSNNSRNCPRLYRNFQRAAAG